MVRSHYVLMLRATAEITLSARLLTIGDDERQSMVIAPRSVYADIPQQTANSVGMSNQCSKGHVAPFQGLAAIDASLLRTVHSQPL